MICRRGIHKKNAPTRCKSLNRDIRSALRTGILIGQAVLGFQSRSKTSTTAQHMEFAAETIVATSDKVVTKRVHLAWACDRVPHKYDRVKARVNEWTKNCR